MRRLDRYIFREVLTPSLIALLALTFALVGRELSRLLELMVNGSATPQEIWGLVKAIVPGALTFTIPMALLTGVLTGFGRMSSDSESVAFRATGLSTWSIFRPVLTLAVLACTLNLYLAVSVAPDSWMQVAELQRTIAMRQAPFAIQERVFNEQLNNLVIYVEDVSPDGTQLRNVFLMDSSDPDQLRITLAELGRLNRVQDGTAFEVTLINGSVHAGSPPSLEDYDYFYFDARTIPIPVPALSIAPVGLAPPRTPTIQLWQALQAPEAGFAEQIEFHRRLALPFACLVFALLGLPLGLSTHRGGRSMGLVVSVALMLGYYLLFVGGSRFAGDQQLSPFLGTWGANLVFLALGLVLLARNRHARVESPWLDSLSNAPYWFRQRLRKLGSRRRSGRSRSLYSLTQHPTWFRTLDLYLLKRFLFFFMLVIVVFVALFVLVTLFELLPDIVENDTNIATVITYFFYYAPQVLYLVTPLSVLVAVFLALGTLTKGNETLAVKAGAISLYRLSAPLVMAAALLSFYVYFMQDYLLPFTNQRQDEIRNTIKGRAPQTYRDPAKLMAGSENRFYHYEYLDAAQNGFAGLSVFTFDPDTFAFRGWMRATRASWGGGVWTYEDGGSRTTVGAEGELDYEAFERSEKRFLADPPEYFRQEVRLASQMNYPELRAYIENLQASGIEVDNLTVSLYRKLSFPLVSVIMAIIAIPFSFTTGQRGAFYGIGISIFIGISYWAAFELFEKLGGINQLSPLIAAWSPNLIYGFGGLWMLLKIRT